ncbi:MAG: hypothetical protein ACOC95_01525 [Planctomycetota bacterium]
MASDDVDSRQEVEEELEDAERDMGTGFEDLAAMIDGEIGLFITADEDVTFVVRVKDVDRARA